MRGFYRLKKHIRDKNGKIQNKMKTKYFVEKTGSEIKKVIEMLHV